MAKAEVRREERMYVCIDVRVDIIEGRGKEEGGEAGGSDRVWRCESVGGGTSR
jgi:hypothetical protein